MPNLTPEQKTDLIAKVADKFPWKQTGNWATITFDETKINTDLANQALDAKLIAPSFARIKGQESLYAAIDQELETAIKEVKGVNATAANDGEKIGTLKTRNGYADDIANQRSQDKTRITKLY